MDTHSAMQRDHTLLNSSQDSLRPNIATSFPETKGNGVYKDYTTSERTQPASPLEARTAIFYDQDATSTKINDISLWMLNHLYQPVPVENFKDHSLVYASPNSKFPWEYKRGNNSLQNTVDDNAPPSNFENVGHPSTPIPSPWVDTFDTTTQNPPSYIITPRTNLTFISQQHSIVFIVDLSSSLTATFDNNSGRLLFSDAFLALEKSLRSLVVPFTLQTISGTITIEPILYITVIAMCSQFGSNINVISILADHPTMKVLVQTAQVSAKNATSVLGRLREAITAFQSDRALLRKKLNARRTKSGYELDVREDHGFGTEYDEVDIGILEYLYLDEPLFQTSRKHTKRSKKSANAIPKSSDTQLTIDETNRPGPSPLIPESTLGRSTKGTWGVGRTGSTLSYILHTGLLSMRLMPVNGRRSIILITDGVVKSDMCDDSLIKRLLRSEVTCNVIQIGSNTGFFPSCNFGFVPDNEVLQFVSSASTGQFLHSDELRTKPDESDTLFVGKPNMYHRRFLFRSMCLERLRPDPSSVKIPNGVPHAAAQYQHVAVHHTAFPWDPMATPLPIDMRLMRYRQYTLPVELRPFIAARLNQGFILSSVARDYGVSGNHNTERILVTLILRWHPQITVEYHIRGYRHTSQSHLTNNNDNSRFVSSGKKDSTAGLSSPFSFLDGLHAAKAAVLVNASSVYVDIPVRNQSIHLPTPHKKKVTQTRTKITVLSPIEQRKYKLRRFLDYVCESDGLLATLISLDQTTEEFTSFWARLDRYHCRTSTHCWYGEKIFESLVMDTVVLSERLTSWSSFIHENGTYLKIIHDLHGGIIPHCPRFCEARILREKDMIHSISILFFNITSSCQSQVIEQIQQLLQQPAEYNVNHAAAEMYPTETAEKWMFNPPSWCILIRRPISCLLIRDADHYATLQNLRSQTNQMWHINSSLLYTGKFIIRNYLHRYARHYHLEDYVRDPRSDLIPLHTLAFTFLWKARVKENFIPLSTHPWMCHFYKEIEYDGMIIAAQYYLWNDTAHSKIETELWLEPVAAEKHELIHAHIFAIDMTIISQLVTFDRLAETRPLTPATYLEPYDPVEFALMGIWRYDENDMFHIPSILQKSPFFTASYPCPKYSARYFEQPEPSESNFPRNQCLVSELEDDQSYRTPTQYLDDIAPLRANVPAVAWSPNIASTLATTAAAIRMWQTDQPALCNCLRPDHIFCKRKDDIASLPSVDRDVALLHYFFEQSLKQIVDQDIDMNHTRSEGFWNRLLQAIGEGSRTDSQMSTFGFATSVNHLRCLVKIFEPTSFAIIVIPSLEAVVDGLQALRADESSVLEKQQRVINLLVFKCRRTTIYDDNDVLSSIDHTLIVDSLITLPINSGIDMEWIDSLGSTLRPDISLGRSAIDFKASETLLSDQTLRLMQDVTRVYCRSFVKSVYSCLLHGRAVDKHDFKTVLDVCGESTVDIDITGYLNMLTLLRRCGQLNTDELEGVQQRFLSILGHYFEPVTFTNGEWRNVYVYRPPLAKAGQKLGLSLSGDNPSNLTDVIVCAHNPLFVRLECTLTKPTQNGPVRKETFAVDYLPSSYGAFEPSDIGTLTSPIASVDGTTATLHIVCLALPLSRYDPIDAYASHLDGCPGEVESHRFTSYLSDDKVYRESLSSLSPDKQGALMETEARLIWLFTEEIMHGLLRSGPVTESVIQYVEAQLMKKNPFVDFPTSMYIPVMFAKNPSISHSVFFEELEHCSRTPYSLIRVGDCFYASDSARSHRISDVFLPEDDKTSMIDVEGLNITLVSKSKSDNSDCNDEFCEGLGISILEPEVDLSLVVSDMMSTKNDEVDMTRQLYWLLLLPRLPERPYVQVYFYSKTPQLVNCPEIIRSTRMMIKYVMERTNKKVLLRMLHDTRICSKYLLDDSQGEKSVPSSEEDSEDESSSSVDSSGEDLVERLSPLGADIAATPPKKFLPGQLGCDIIYAKHFPLHWRLQPNAALNYLSKNVLQAFAVKNRPSMYVFMRDNSIVYCFLSERVVSPSERDQDPDQDRHSSTSSTHQLQRTVGSESGINPSASQRLHTSAKSCSSPQDSVHSEYQRSSPSKENTSNTSPSMRKSHEREYRELVLQVHGLEYCRWIADELVDLIDNRLVSQVILPEVQQFLMRNPGSRLSRADVEHLLPVERDPSRSQILRIPTLVSNPLHFMDLLKQNLGKGHVRVIDGNGVASIVGRHQALRYGAHRLTQAWCDRESQHRITPGEPMGTDYCFYYSCSQKMPIHCTPFELTVGQGAAGICLSLLDRQLVAYKQLPQTSEQTLNITTDSLTECLDDDFKQDEVESEHHLGIDIWNIGQINEDVIFEYVYSCFYQTICDYCIERIAKQSQEEPAKSEIQLNVSLEKDNETFQLVVPPIMTVLNRALEWKCPSLEFISRDISLSPWAMDDVLQKLSVDLADIHLTLKPVIAYSNTKGTKQGSRVMTDILYTLHHPSLETMPMEKYQHMQQDQRFTAFCGFPELLHKGKLSLSRTSSRRQSTESEHTPHNRSPMLRTSNNDDSDVPAALYQANGADSSHSRHDSVTSGTSGKMTAISPKYMRQYKENLHQHSFMVVIIETTQVLFYAYNCTRATTEQTIQSLQRIIQLQETRQKILENILHQKMGLFYQVDPITDILDSMPTLSPWVISSTTGINSGNSTSRSVRGSSLTITTKVPPLSPSLQAANRHSYVGDAIATPKTPARIPTSVSVASALSNDRGPTTRTTLSGFTQLKQLMLTSTREPIRTGDGDHAETGTIDVSGDGDEPRAIGSPAISLIRKSAAELGINTILRNEYSTFETNDRPRDYVVRHGKPFLDLYERLFRIRAAHEKALSGYSKWSAPGSKLLKDDLAREEAEPMTVFELRMILKASRLLHFCRTQLLLSISTVQLDKITEGPSYLSDSSRSWYKTLASTFMNKYSTYLQSIGMYLLSYGPPGDDHMDEPMEAYSSQLKVAEDTVIHVPVVYLLRVFKGGTIMCEVQLVDTSVSVTLYRLHRRYERPSYSPYAQEKYRNKKKVYRGFIKECNRLKHGIHINAFVSDFRLWFFGQCLNNSSQEWVHELDLLRMIESTEQMSNIPDTFACNRIMHGEYIAPEDEFLPKLIPTIARNASKFGFRTLTNGQSGVAAYFVSCKDLSFTDTIQDDNQVLPYTLLITNKIENDLNDDPNFLSKDKENEEDVSMAPLIVFQYYILIVRRDFEQPYADTQLGMVPAYQKMLCEAVPSMNDIVKHARKRLDLLVKAALSYCRLETDWRAFHQLVVSGACRHNPSKTAELAGRFNALSIEKFDTNFSALLRLKLPWERFFDLLRQAYPLTNGDLEVQHMYHFVVFIPASELRYFVHVAYNKHNQSVSVSVSDKEASWVEDNSTDIKQIVYTLGTMANYIMWKEFSR